MNLQSEILDRLDNKTLLELHETWPSLRTDLEFSRRLSNCDYSVLDYIDKITPTKELIDGFKKMQKCIPWRIGVIYNYQTGKIYQIEISMGITERYIVNNRPILFSWLDSSKNFLMLREITNQHDTPFSIRFDENWSSNISNFLLNSEKINLTLGYFQGRKTFQMPLPYSEQVEIVPVSISNEIGKIDLFNENIRSITTSETIKFSPEVKKYKEIVKKWEKYLN